MSLLVQVKIDLQLLIDPFAVEKSFSSVMKAVFIFGIP